MGRAIFQTTCRASPWLDKEHVKSQTEQVASVTSAREVRKHRNVCPRGIYVGGSWHLVRPVFPPDCADSDQRDSKNRQQYGGYQGGDKDDHPAPSQKGGGTGGGSAGGKKGGNMDLKYQKQIPKFLQRYSHMLNVKGGGGGQGEDESVVLVPDGSTMDALRRAMADNPELVKEFEGKLSQKLNMATALEEKEKGNQFFGKKKYQDAIKSFTKCIELDPENEVFYSNRSASHALLPTPDYEAALKDAKMACKLKPSWAKAFSRLGAAYLGLKLYSEAREAYEKGVRIEPDDQVMQKSMEKAEALELQQSLGNKHTFKKMRAGGGGGDKATWASKALAGGGDGGDKGAASASGAAAQDGCGTGSGAGSGVSKAAVPDKGKKSLLSFAMDDDE
eukprot:gene16714-22984_t